jgi:ATP-dependent protease ClpP protease subunit
MYVVDINSEEPIMLLNKQIGKSTLENGEWDGTPYVDGAEFQQELLYLDSLGKKRIQVWINSPGGSIMEAMNIFNAILKSKTPVDTYNVGVCASSAGAVFMAGRKRIMCDYAQFMMHPVSGTTDPKAGQAFKAAIVSMLQPKSNLNEAVISFMMDKTTWIGAAECFAKGICTEIEYTKDSNKKYMPSEAQAMLAYSNNIVNDLITHKNPIQMVKVTNKLGLNEGANEETILSAINKLETANAEAQNKLTAIQNQLDEATQAKEKAEADLEKANAQIEEANKAKESAEESAQEVAATEMVNSFKNKLGEKPEVLTKWINLAKADLAGTKTMLEELPLNVAAPEADKTPVNALKYSAASRMAEINNKTQNK